MIHNQLLAPNLKTFNMANLLDHSMILLNAPVIVMQLLKIMPTKNSIIIRTWQPNNVVPLLVF